MAQRSNINLLTVVTHNVRGMLFALEDTAYLISRTNPDILILTETKLHRPMHHQEGKQASPHQARPTGVATATNLPQSPAPKTGLASEE